MTTRRKPWRRVVRTHISLRSLLRSVVRSFVRSCVCWCIIKTRKPHHAADYAIALGWLFNDVYKHTHTHTEWTGRDGLDILFTSAPLRQDVNSLFQLKIRITWKHDRQTWAKWASRRLHFCVWQQCRAFSSDKTTTTKNGTEIEGQQSTGWSRATEWLGVFEYSISIFLYSLDVCCCCECFAWVECVVFTWAFSPQMKK